jgi:DNA modification methylase
MRLILGDSLEVLKKFEDNSIDSIVTDAPYGLSFMGRKWDYDVPSQEIWEECLRVLKPGGYLLAFAGTRTQHRMAVRIEDAGFEIRDMIAWVYGSGFPKSLNIGKAIDKLQGNKNKELPTIPMQEKGEVGEISKNRRCAICKLPLASANPCKCDRQYKANNDWTGFGTSLKPALEPITVARKPISEKTVAENVLKYGTGGINIDGCRVGTEQVQTTAHKTLGDGIKYGKSKPFEASEMRTGRFPANLIHDGSDEVVGLFPDVKGSKASGLTPTKARATFNNSILGINRTGFNDLGSASRFFYCAKASKSERNKGLEGFEEKAGIRTNAPRENEEVKNPVNKNHHPTVKPISLMRYLCRLVTPKGGTVLDPFMGSGTTGIGAKLEGFDFIGIEREAEYIKIAEARINAWQKDNKLL